MNLRTSGGFTFIEILATLTFTAIVLPVTLRGISMAASSASESKRRNEATVLAQNLLAKFVAGNDVQFSVLSGDFTPEKPEYRWTAEITDRTEGNLKELTVRVLWTSRNRGQSLALSTLVYTGIQ